MAATLLPGIRVYRMVSLREPAQRCIQPRADGMIDLHHLVHGMQLRMHIGGHGLGHLVPAMIVRVGVAHHPQHVVKRQLPGGADLFQALLRHLIPGSGLSACPLPHSAAAHFEFFDCF
jgi:hypothetical protein